MTIGLIICGALAHEVVDIVERNGWDVKIIGVSALNHVFVDRIAPDVEQRIQAAGDKYDRLFVVYGDCGTGGALDTMLARYNVERIDGPHCYQWYGKEGFSALMDEEPGTFFLTDYMVRTFRGMILKGLGLDRYPELRDEYFRHYKRIVYLVQKPDPQLVERARAAANYLGLPLEVHATGYGWLEERLAQAMTAD